MKVDLQINKTQILSQINAARSEILAKADKAILQVAVFGTQIILDRTERGVGYKGGFEPYSPTYALFRKSKGRGTVVNLDFTGKMLGSMAQRRSGNLSADIYFTRSSEAAKAAGNDARRPFFGFNAQEQSRLQTFFSGKINE